MSCILIETRPWLIILAHGMPAFVLGNMNWLFLDLTAQRYRVGYHHHPIIIVCMHRMISRLFRLFSRVRSVFNQGEFEPGPPTPNARALQENIIFCVSPIYDLVSVQEVRDMRLTYCMRHYCAPKSIK